MSASAVQAQEYYTQVELGVVASGSTDMTLNLSGATGSADADTKLGLLAGALIGRELQHGFAVEGEMFYAGAKIDTDEVDSLLGTDLDASVGATLMMLNGKYTFETGKAWAPYVGAGVGYGQIRYEVADTEETDNGVAWQAKVGFTYKRSDELTWDIGYRYVQTPEFISKDGFDSLKMDTSFHAFSIGARFGF